MFLGIGEVGLFLWKAAVRAFREKPASRIAEGFYSTILIFLSYCYCVFCLNYRCKRVLVDIYI